MIGWVCVDVLADRHVHYDFWTSFCGSAGVFCMGEVFGDDIGSVTSHLHIPSTSPHPTSSSTHFISPSPTQQPPTKQPRSDLPILNGLRAQLSDVRRARGRIRDSRTGEYDGCDGDVGGVAGANEGLSVFFNVFLPLLALSCLWSWFRETSLTIFLWRDWCGVDTGRDGAGQFPREPGCGAMGEHVE